MQIETLGDVLDWTLAFHQNLSKCMAHCADKQENERAKLLLDYLSEQEKYLSTVIEGFQQSASTNALNTWCYEYLDKYPIVRHEKCTTPFSELSASEIIREVEYLHSQIIAFYRYLGSRADAPSARALLDQLTALEEHEAMRMTQSANRLEDL